MIIEICQEEYLIQFDICVTWHNLQGLNLIPSYGHEVRCKRQLRDYIKILRSLTEEKGKRISKSMLPS